MSSVVSHPHPNEHHSAQVRRFDANIIGEPRVERVTPRVAGPFNDTKNCIIELSSDSQLLDGFESFLEFTVATPAESFNLDGTAHTFIRRVMLKTKNGTVLTEIPHYNLIHSVMYHAESSPNRGKREWIQRAQELDTVEATKTAIGTTETRFCLHLMLDLFHRGRWLHLPELGGLKLEFEFEKIGLVASSKVGATAPTSYNIDNVVFNARMIPMSQKYLDELRKVARSGNLVYQAKQWVVTSDSVSGNTAQLSLRDGYSSVSRAFVVHQLSSDDNETMVQQNLDVDGIKKFSRFIPPHQSGQTYSQIFQHGTSRYPSNAIESEEVAFAHLESALNHTRDLNISGTYLELDRYLGRETIQSRSPLYIVAIDFTRAGRNSGLDLDSAGLIYKMSSSGAQANQNVSLMAEVDTIVQVLGPREVRIEV